MQAAWNQWATSTMGQGAAQAGMAAAAPTAAAGPAAQPSMNYQYYGGAATTPAAATPAAATPATAMPTLPTYTAEQWALLTPEQQSWHMAQWHQQQAYYTQWQQMAAAQAAAAQAQAAAAAAQQATAVPPPLPPASQAAPPPLPDEKKRPADDKSAETGASKKPKTDDKSSSSTPGGGGTGTSKPESLEDLLELRKSFDTQFSNWENEYFKWKEANANHPDQAQKREYEAKWSQWREQLLHKRDVIDKKIADKKKSIEEEERKKEEERGKAASAWNNAYNALSSAPSTTNWLGATTAPPQANNAPLQFMTRTTGGVSRIPGLGDSKTDSAAGKNSGGLPGDKPLDNTKPLWTSDNAPFNFPTPAVAAAASNAAAVAAATNTTATPAAANPYAQSYPGMGGTHAYPGMPGYGMMMQPGAGYNPMMPYQYPGMSGMMAPQYPGMNAPVPGQGALPPNNAAPGQQSQQQGFSQQGGPTSQYQGGPNAQYPGPGGPASQNSQYQGGPNSQYQQGGSNAQYPGGPNAQYPGGQNQNSQGSAHMGADGYGPPKGPPNMGMPPPVVARKSRFSDATDQNEFGGRGENNSRGGPGMGGPGPHDNMSGPYGNNMGGPRGNSNNMGPSGANNMGPNGGRASFGNSVPPPSRYVDKYAKKYEEDDETEFENYHQRFAAEDGTEEDTGANNWRSGPAGMDRNSSGGFNRGGRDSGGFGGRDKFGGAQDGYGGNNRNSFGNNRDSFGNNRDSFGNNRDSFGGKNGGGRDGGNDFGFGSGPRNSFGHENNFSATRGGPPANNSGGPPSRDYRSGPPANNSGGPPSRDFRGGPPANNSGGQPSRDFSGRNSFGPNQGPGGPPSRFAPMEEDPYSGPTPQEGKPEPYGAPPPSKSRWGAAREIENQPPGPKKPPPDPPAPEEKPHTCIVIEYNHRKVPAAMSIELMKGYNEPYKGPVYVFEYSHGANKGEFFRQRAASPSHPSRRRSPLRENFTSPTVTTRDTSRRIILNPDLRDSRETKTTRDTSRRTVLNPDLRDSRETNRREDSRTDRRSPDRRYDRDRRSPPDRRMDRHSPERRADRDRLSPERRLDRDRRVDRDRHSPDYGMDARDHDRWVRDRPPDDRPMSDQTMDVEARLNSLGDRLVQERRKLADKARSIEQKKIAIEDLLELPARETRPSRIVIFLRGPPCSGKSFLAKLIKDKEAQHGGTENMRILSLDDYFMTNEVEKETVDERGFKKKIKAFEYEYERELEESYRQNLVKSFKKNINDAYFSFVIVDACNDKLSHYAEMYVHAKSKGFAVYIAETVRDVSFCMANNVHARTEADIQAIVNGFETTPKEQVLLDTTSLLQSAEIEDVEMEDVENEDGNDVTSENGDQLTGENSVEVLSDDEDDVVELDAASKFTIPSKWDNIDHSIGEIKAKLDGLCRKPAKSLREWLHGDEGDELSIYKSSRGVDKGKKRVRWADIEERFEQDKMKAIGFIVGGTDWNRMMDPESGVNRLNQTKYI